MARTVKKPQERKADIVNAARYLFQTKEYDKTTMQDVVNYLGIAKGTVYHYFASKEDLLEAVVHDIVDKSIEHMTRLLARSKRSVLGKMKLLMQAGNVAAENEGILHELHRPGNETMHTRLLAAALVKQAPLYAELIKQGCDEGIFQTDTPLECAEFILSGVQFLTDVGIYPWTQEDLQRRVRAFPALIEQQLKASPGSFQFMVKLLRIRN
ncbi:MAG: TetR/AcrR family transcriptional regulator [Candidatus Babeliales bacterium]